MKKLSIFVLTAFIVMTTGFIACKSKPKDADIKTAVENALKADPASTGAMVTVNKGVVTIDGACIDDASKSHTGDVVKGIKGVKEVINNCVVAPPPPVNEVVVNPGDDELNKALTDALKDNSTVQYSLNNGKIVLTGEIKKAKWMSLKQTLDKLKSKGYDLTGLKIN